MKGDGKAAEWLTIEAAAAHLGVSVPRLRRLLTRADFAPLVETRTRQTRTGTRTAQGVPVPVLVSLRAALLSREHEMDASPSQEGQGEWVANENGNESEREREQAQGEPFETVPVPVMLDVPSGEVLYLRARLAEALSLLAREQQAHAETRQITARLMLQSGEGQSVNGNGAAPVADATQACAEGANSRPNEQAGQSVKPNEKRPFWARLWQKKEGR